MEEAESCGSDASPARLLGLASYLGACINKGSYSSTIPVYSRKAKEEEGRGSALRGSLLLPALHPKSTQPLLLSFQGKGSTGYLEFP